MGRDLSGVLDAVLAGIVVVDTSGCIDLMNSAACRILEVSAETLAGQPIERLLGDRHPAAATLVHKVLATGCATIQYELPIEHRFDDAVEIDLAISPLFDDEMLEWNRGTVTVGMNGEDRGSTSLDLAEDGPHEAASLVDAERFFDHFFSVTG